MSRMRIDRDAALRAILEGTAAHIGTPFFEALVANLCVLLDAHGAWVTEFVPESRRLRSLAFRCGGEWVRDYEYAVDGTPCELVVDRLDLVHIPDRVVELFPRDPDLPPQGAVSYLGVPLLDTDGSLLGHLAIIDSRPMPEDEEAVTLFRIFAARATAELQRLRAETELREREARLRRVVEGAHDAIVELDPALRVTVLNPAAEAMFECVAADALGGDFRAFLDGDAAATLDRLLADLARRPPAERGAWLPDGLPLRTARGATFRAEATLARTDARGAAHYTLILRNRDERLEAERRIRALADQAEYLRAELAEREGRHGLLGRSAAMVRVLRAVDQVAGTDATVLVTGETGTGKELVARAIHGASARRNRPLVRVNCAAIPGNLIESEFFGHEKGAFTGATGRRDGRFALADGGTIFLDEIGELPLELQAKLLRVLQEGEFEPVGSSTTRRVDVRVVAATNRDLAGEATAGRFREDLYYRLNVFPVAVPPLRERAEDVLLLAHAFAREFGQRMGRTLEPLDADATRRLTAYPWPGNVRELRNVIERAVITARDGRLDFRGVLPEAGAAAPDSPGEAWAAHQPGGEGGSAPFRTEEEMRELERANLRRALEACGWRIAGESGAARRLGLRPSTLTSRLKALGIQRPLPVTDREIS